MTQSIINLQQFVGYDPAAFKEYLLENMPKGKQWQFILPQAVWSPEHSNEHVMYQYAIAMHIGQLLSPLCFTLGYSVPSPYSKGEFLFSAKIRGSKLTVLSELLSLIANDYLAEDPSPEWNYLVEKAIQIMGDESRWKKDVPVCAGLLMVCEQFCEPSDSQ